jgi:hypothetical protein
MAENINPTFQFGPLANFKMYSGEGGADCVPFDGIVKVTTTSFSTYTSKAKPGEQGKPMVRWNMVIEDEDAKGMRLISHVHAGGVDRHGEPMARQLAESMVSMGTTEENIQKNAQQNAAMPLVELCEKYVGRTGYVEISADEYEGEETTRVDNWVTAERYTQAKSVGAHRKPRKKVSPKRDQQVVQGAADVNIGGGQTQATTPPAAAGNETAPPADGSSTFPML